MKKLLISLSTICLALIPAVVLAQNNFDLTFQQIPFFSADGNTTQGYIDALYQITIAAGAIIAVLRIILSGARYMFSDIITTKKDAVKEIQGALLGLLIILGAVTILNTINPELTKVDILGRLNQTTTPGGRPADSTRRTVTWETFAKDAAEAEVIKQECTSYGGTPGTPRPLSRGFAVPCTKDNATTN